MLTTGTVQLSLADVDKLRDEIKQGQELAKSKDAEIEQLKAKQREVLIKEIQLVDDGLEIDTLGMHHDMHSVINLQREGWAMSYSSRDYEIDKVVRRRVKPKFKEVEKKTYYKNLDDIQAELRVRFEAEYEERLRDMNSKVKGCDDSIRDVKDKELAKYTEMRRYMQNEIDQKKEVIEKMDKKIQELETGVKEKKENERLKEAEEKMIFMYNELVQRVQAVMEKSWFKRIFGGLNEAINIEEIRKAAEKKYAEKDK